MKWTCCLLLFTSSLCVRAQSNTEVKQLYNLISFKSPFLLRTPSNPSNYLKRLSLHDTLTLNYSTQFPPHRIDTKRLVEIVTNRLAVDTTCWETQELDGVVWVDNRTQRLTITDLLNRSQNLDRQQIATYRRRIRKYNSGITTSSNNFYYGLVASLSKPIFDRERHYAVLMRDYFHLGGEIILFEKEKKFGTSSVF
jgi:hypothetical protein